jgi:perosamine synthetase
VTSEHTGNEPIPFLDPYVLAKYGENVAAQIATGFLGPGAATQRFCRELTDHLAIPNLLATVSGTVALTVAAHALALEPGSEIIVPGYGVISTINGLAVAGLSPRLADIDKVTGCVSVETLEARVTDKTAAVCFVNFSGYTGANVVAIRKWCDARGLLMIEDAACAFGHSYEGKSAGGFGHIGCYSFSVPKVLTTGQGGALTAADPKVFNRAGEYIDQGDLEWRKTGVNRKIGTNLRFNDIQASFGLAMLADIQTRQTRRREAHATLRAALGDCLYKVPGNEAPLHNIVFSNEPARLVAYLKERRIGAQQQYCTLYDHPAYASLRSDLCPAGEWWTAKAVYLPFGSGLSIHQAERIAEAILASRTDLIPLR